MKKYLKTKLVEYMIPQFLIFLDKIPLSSRCKIGKKLLPLPNFICEASYIAPRNITEIEIEKIWVKGQLI